MQEIVVHSTHRQQLVDMTQDVVHATRGWTCSAVLIFVRHTTAGVLINEHADPDVATDMLRALDVMVPDSLAYLHAEGNSPAHVKTMLVGTMTSSHGSRLIGVFTRRGKLPGTRKDDVSGIVPDGADA